MLNSYYRKFIDQSLFLTFDDVLIRPEFSTIKSRKDVDISSKLFDLTLQVPIISSNMDTVTNSEMAISMFNAGGIGCLHRFWSVEENVKQFLKIRESGAEVLVSVGLGESEFDRVKALAEVGAKYFIIDVAHGAQISVIDQIIKIRESYKDSIYITVGNFASGSSLFYFLEEIRKEKLKIDGIKIGIGNGSICSTRLKTGVGVPQLSAILECSGFNGVVISDGGVKTPGDIAKALAAGATHVMTGGMVAGTEEAPGEIVFLEEDDCRIPYKYYRGSASEASYKVQNKLAEWRTAEGVETMVPFKGPVKNVLSDIEGGLRSSLSYVGARNLKEFFEKSNFIVVSNNALMESKTVDKRGNK